MSVAVFVGDRGGCGAYRLRFPAEAVRDIGGIDVHVVTPDDELGVGFAAQPQPDGTMLVKAVDLTSVPDVDTIVMQRPIQDTGWQFVKHLRTAGFRVVVDVDDDFDRLHPNNPAARQCLTPRYSPANIHRAISEADACTVSTPALADRYGNNGTPTTVLPNMVPAWYLDLDTTPEPGVIGWAGSIATHHNDLAELGGTLGVMQRDGWTIKVVGRATRESLGADPLLVPWVPLDEYPTQVGTFGVGVVPLKLSAFNEAKSWLKGLEYASLGVPFAASPTGPYRQLHDKYGLGVLVEKPKHWRRSILQAVDQGGQRDRVRRAGLTFADRWQDWANVWDR